MIDAPHEFKPRPLAAIRCARCACEVERVTLDASEPGSLRFVVACHGETQTLTVDEAALAGHKIVGGEAFSDNPGIDLRAWGDGFAP